jgi:hypothetical protein
MKPVLRARVGEDLFAREITVPGRFAWALNELVKSGASGCTPIEHPGPRWSHYVWRLRHEWGVPIETVTEGHAGPYAGSHARYVLRAPVTILEQSGLDRV